MADNDTFTVEIVTDEREGKKYKATITQEIYFTLYPDEDGKFEEVNKEFLEYLSIEGGDDDTCIMDFDLSHTTECKWEEVVDDGQEAQSS